MEDIGRFLQLTVPAKHRNIEIRAVATLEDAEAGDISFFSNHRYREHLNNTEASAVFVREGEAVPAGTIALRVDNPYLAMARVRQFLHPSDEVRPLRSERAYIAKTANVDPSARVEAFAWIGENVVIGAHSHIEAHVRIGDDACIGSHCHIQSGVSVRSGSIIGDRVTLQSGSVVGTDGFGYVPEADNFKILHRGSVVIESDVEIGANACVDRASFGETRVGRGTKTDNLTQIAHGVRVGAHTLLVAFSGIAGSSKVGSRVVLAAKSAVLGHLEVGDGTILSAGTILSKDSPKNKRWSGFPAIPHRDWLRSATIFPKLPILWKTVRTPSLLRIHSFEKTEDAWRGEIELKRRELDLFLKQVEEVWGAKTYHWERIICKEPLPIHGLVEAPCR